MDRSCELVRPDIFACDQMIHVATQELYSDEEVDASSPTGAGWQTFPAGKYMGQGSEHSQTNSFELVSGRPKSSSSSVRSESSSLWREPAPPYTLSDLKITFEVRRTLTLIEAYN